MPREHGAYAQLAAPLFTALVLMRPTVASGLLAVAAICAFLANEPLLVVLGHRGKRLREQAGALAARRLLLLLAATAFSGAIGLALAGIRTVEMAALVAPAVVLTVIAAWRRAEHSLVGELVAAVALSGASAPVLVASGASLCTASLAWAGWAIGYACTVVAVHRVIARHRSEASWHDGLAAIVLLTLTAGAIVLLARGTPAGLATPLALAGTILVFRPPRATYLRAIGVALVVASVIAAGLAFALL